mmetsp:Transcript_79/g.133  ORF Transcript_79/g.133 Transcript_79/m.133 type:complete len:106 (+) Transcript_79:82-399(+)
MSVFQDSIYEVIYFMQEGDFPATLFVLVMEGWMLRFSILRALLLCFLIEEEPAVDVESVSDLDLETGFAVSLIVLFTVTDWHLHHSPRVTAVTTSCFFHDKKRLE